MDVLAHDEDWCVRTEVAEQGYGLDILVHDEEWCVRAAVAKQGYGLNILSHDKNPDVRQIAISNSNLVSKSPLETTINQATARAETSKSPNLNNRRTGKDDR